MNILPVGFVTFTGKEVPYNTSAGTSGIKNMPDFYPNSSIEKTLGSHHSYRKDKVYFAAPMEFISDDIKERVDFVVYDNEPSYPTIDEVKRNYLGTNRTDYRKHFENVREYYYRREMGGFASSNEAKYQQWQSAVCTGLYDKAGDLRYRKETAEDEVKALRAEKAAINAGIESTNKEIAAQLKLKQGLKKYIRALEKIQSPFEELGNILPNGISSENKLYETAEKRVSVAKEKSEGQKALENSAMYNEGREAYPYDGLKYGKYEDTTATYKALDDIKKEGFKISGKKNHFSGTDDIKNTIKKLKDILDENTRTIEEMNEYVTELREKLKSTNSKIKEKSSFIQECKNKLMPLFDELANFYKKQGIKVIKK